MGWQMGSSMGGEDSSTATFRLGFVPSGAYIPLIAASRFFTPIVITASRRSGSAYPSWLWNTSYSLPFWRLGLQQWDGRGGLCFVSMGVCLLYVFTLGVVSASLSSSQLSSHPGSLRVAVWYGQVWCVRVTDHRELGVKHDVIVYLGTRRIGCRLPNSMSLPSVSETLKSDRSWQSPPGRWLPLQGRVWTA